MWCYRCGLHSTFFKEGTVLIKPTTKHVHRQSDAETMSQTTVPLSVCWALLRSAREALKSGERTFLPCPHPGKGRALTKMLITPSHHKWTQHQSTIVCTSGICQLFLNKQKHNWSSAISTNCANIFPHPTHTTTPQHQGAITVPRERICHNPGGGGARLPLQTCKTRDLPSQGTRSHFWVSVPRGSHKFGF